MYSLLSSFYFRIALLFRFVIFMFLFINCVWLIYLIRKDLRQTIFIWTWGTHCFNSIRNVVIIYVSLSLSVYLSFCIYLYTHVYISVHLSDFRMGGQKWVGGGLGASLFQFQFVVSKYNQSNELFGSPTPWIYIYIFLIYIYICMHTYIEAGSELCSCF